jgi:hypothetical protein
MSAPEIGTPSFNTDVGEGHCHLTPSHHVLQPNIQESFWNVLGIRVIIITLLSVIANWYTSPEPPSHSVTRAQPLVCENILM